MLTHAGLGHVQRLRKFARGGLGALQALNDAALGGSELRLDVGHLQGHYRKRTLAERTSAMTATELRPGEVRAGSADELRTNGQLVTKVGSLPVVVFWNDDTAYAIED